MNRSIWPPAVLVLAAVLAGCATTTPPNQEAAVLRAKDRVAPSLVHIRPVKEVFAAGRREEVVVQGSGFIISPDGYVVTNEHVAGQSDRVKCILPSKEELDAEVVGTDPYTDIAVLKLRTDRTDLPHVKLGSSDRLEAGQTVLALGSPHGLSRSVSSGIVSVTDRYLPDQDEETAPFNNWIQTDAAINPGNSGGPLVNLRGEVVGINARKLTHADNVGFAIPIDVAKPIIEELIEKGKVERSWIGVSLQEMMSTTEDPTRKGVVVADVDPLSPASDAGIQPGDILLAVNGEEVNARYVEGLPAARRTIASLAVGEPATLRILRGAETVDVTVTTVQKSNPRGNEAEFEAWGFSAKEVTPLVARQAQLPSLQGLLVSGVQVGSPAGNARLQPGDIVLKVDDRDVADLEDFRAAYDEAVAAGKRLVLLDVKRGALSRYVLLEQNGANGTTAAMIGPAAEGAELDVE